MSNSRKRLFEMVVPNNGLDEVLSQSVDKYEQQQLIFNFYIYNLQEYLLPLLVTKLIEAGARVKYTEVCEIDDGLDEILSQSRDMFEEEMKGIEDPVDIRDMFGRGGTSGFWSNCFNSHKLM